MTFTTVDSKGLLHALPTFPDHEGRKYTALVTGANGISGSFLVDTLSQAPQRWSAVYALSRRLPEPSANGGSLVHPVAVDFLKSTPEEIARILRDNEVQADYVFFTSYLQPPPKDGGGPWSDRDELDRVNNLLLSNFLSALKLASIKPKRFILQTGGKHYGLHLGPTSTPETESDPRPLMEPNFYFDQEDMVWSYVKDQSVEWVVHRPGFILGAVKDAQISIVWPLAIYAAIQKELGGTLDFPGDIAAWETEKSLTTSALLGHFAEWAALTPAAANQALNISDSSLFSYGQFWTILAKTYGIGYTTPVDDPAAYQKFEMPWDAPRGFGPRGVIYTSWTFAEWAKKPEVVAAWEKLQARHGLRKSPFKDITNSFGLLDVEIPVPWPRAISMDKARKLGWNGYVDTRESIIGIIKDLADLKMVPPL